MMVMALNEFKAELVLHLITMHFSVQSIKYYFKFQLYLIYQVPVSEVMFVNFVNQILVSFARQVPALFAQLMLA